MYMLSHYKRDIMYIGLYIPDTVCVCITGYEEWKVQGRRGTIFLNHQKLSTCTPLSFSPLSAVRLHYV